MHRGLTFLLFFFWCCHTSLTTAATFDYPACLREGQTVRDDVYMFGMTPTINGKVIGDLLAIGKSISYHGAVAGDLLALGLQIASDGIINDDLRAIGLHADICGDIGDDAILAGFKIKVLPESRIGHTTVVTAGQAVLNGHMRGDVIVNAYDCVLAGSVEGNARVAASQLQLAPTARIKGNLVYRGQKPLVIPPGAIVEGEIIQQNIGSPANSLSLPGQEGKWLKLLGFAIWDAGLLVIGTGLLLFIPQTVHTPSKIMTTKPWLACFYGFLWLVGAPVVAAIGMLTIVGLPLSIAIVFLYVSSLYLSTLPVALWLGQRFCRLRHRPCLSLTIGLVVLSVCRNLPYLGPIISLLVLTVGLGSLTLSFRYFLRDLTKKN